MPPDLFELVYLLLELLELGPLVLARLRLLVEPLQERAQQEEVVGDD